MSMVDAQERFDPAPRKIMRSQPAYGTLSGRVVEVRGLPVSGARVWTDDVGERFAEVRTDADGVFHLGPMPALYRPNFDLLVEADGFARQYVRDRSFSIFAGDDYDLGTIVLHRGRVFSGQVFDEDGSPMSGAVVECEPYRMELGHTSQTIGRAIEVVTDALGWFRTPPLPVAKLSLVVRVPGRQLAWVLRDVVAEGEEEVPPFRLQRHVPILGVVRADDGTPLVGVRIGAGDVPIESAADGSFVLSGFGPRPDFFQMRAWREGYAAINWCVEGRDDGLYWRDNDGDRQWRGPIDRLSIVLKPVAWISGLAVDAETGEPVHIQSVVCCTFERGADGQPIRRGCRGGDFEQPRIGQFRVPYSVAIEYILTISADGYHDAEIFTPEVSRPQPIEGLVARLRKRTRESSPNLPQQRISGKVLRDGRPVECGWIGLWRPCRATEAFNAFIMRGRTVEGAAATWGQLLTAGAYSIEVPFQAKNWFLVVEEPGHALTQVGPIEAALDEKKAIDIECLEGGEIRGAIRNVPIGLEAQLWVVAFTKMGLRVEVRSAQDGTFRLGRLPPGEYGLKVGHDAYDDSEVPRGRPIPPEMAELSADPWRRATIVTVQSGKITSGIELELPHEPTSIPSTPSLATA